MSDLRYAIRQLARRPGFTLLVVLTLALGIGATTAISSVVDGYLLRPLPFPEPERLVAVNDVQPSYGVAPASLEEWRDLAEHGRLFEAVTAFDALNLNYAGADLPERLSVLLVGGPYFDLMGLAPVAGRLFTPAEQEAGGDPVIVVSEWFWRSRLGGRPEALGAPVRLSDRPYTVVGVVPDPAVTSPNPPAAYAPLVPNAPWGDRDTHYLNVVARLAAGLTPEAARAELDALAKTLQADRGTDHGWAMTPLREAMVGDVRPLLLGLLGAAGLVLFIATANVANLTLVHAAGRDAEFAVRTALGARRARLVRQLLTEGFLLGALGATAGGLLGTFGTAALVEALPGSADRPGPVAFDFRVLAFTVVVALASTAFFSLTPAFFGMRRSNEALGATRGTSGVRARRLRDALVVAELALSMVLLIGAGLMLQSFQRLLRVDPGFRPEGVLTVSTALPSARYSEPAQRLAFVEEMLTRLSALPQVRGAAVANDVPMSGSMSGGVAVEGRTFAAADRPSAEKRIVSDGYFGVLGIPLLRGRFFTPTDRDGSPQVVIVGEATARRLWPGEEALGKRIRSLTCGNDCWEEVVGVVGNVRELGIHQDAPLAVYYPLRQLPLSGMDVAIRTDADPMALVPSVRRAVSIIDPGQPIANPRPLTALVAATVAGRHLATVLLTTFAAIALLLAAVGVAGLLSYAVTQRTREIGLRMALGSTPRAVTLLVTRDGLRLLVFGLLLGVPAALSLVRFLDTQLYEVTPTQPAAYVAAALILALAALASSYAPARRASRVDPMEALRHE